MGPPGTPQRAARRFANGKADYLTGLRKIEGHVRGLQKMIEAKPGAQTWSRKSAWSPAPSALPPARAWLARAPSCFNCICSSWSVDQDAGDCAKGDENWFGNLAPEEQAEREERDSSRWDIDDDLAAQHHDGAGDGSGGCGGGAFDEGLDLGVVAVPDEPASGHGDAEADGDENGGGGDEGAGQAGDEVADEGGGDDDRPWGDQAHRDGVDELAAGQPVVLDDDSLPQERDDGQAAAEDERPGLEEEQAKRDQDPG